MALRSTNKLFRGKCTSNSLYQPLLSDKGKEMFQLQWLYYWLGVLLNSELYCSFAQFKDLEVQEGNIINKGTETSTCHSLRCRQALHRVPLETASGETNFNVVLLSFYALMWKSLHCTVLTNLISGTRVHLHNKSYHM